MILPNDNVEKQKFYMQDGPHSFCDGLDCISDGSGWIVKKVKSPVCINPRKE